MGGKEEAKKERQGREEKKRGREAGRKKEWNDERCEETP